MGRDLDSYLGYPAGPRPVPNRSRLLKLLFYALFTRFPFLINRIINRKKRVFISRAILASKLVSRAEIAIRAASRTVFEPR
jgi:hypothetical protein